MGRFFGKRPYGGMGWRNNQSCLEAHKALFGFPHRMVCSYLGLDGCREDLHRVLSNHPFTIEKKKLHPVPWVPGMDRRTFLPIFRASRYSFLLFQCCEFPLDWNMKISASRKLLSYARICIVVDLSKELPNQDIICGWSGKEPRLLQRCWRVKANVDSQQKPLWKS